MIAVYDGHVELTKLLIDANASVNAVDPFNRSPLFIACDEGPVPSRYDCAKLVLATARRDQKTGLSCFINHWSNARGNRQAIAGRPPPTHTCPRESGIASVCPDVLRRIVELATPDPPRLLEVTANAGPALTGVTALMQAAETSQIKCVRLLLEYGACDVARNSNGECAEELAPRDDDVVNVLREWTPARGICPNKRQPCKNILAAAADTKGNHGPCVLKLARTRGQWARTDGRALLAAARCNNVSVAESLVRLKACVHGSSTACRNDATTPLATARKSDAHEVLQLLLEAKATPSSTGECNCCEFATTL